MRRLLLPLIALLVLAGACGGDDSSSDSTTSTAGVFSLTSSAFGDGELIPDEYAFGNENESPPLSWSDVPAGTAELAVAVVDPDASNFVHWVVGAVDPSVSEFETGRLPAGTVETLNSFNEAAWSGPAPPAGTRHTYVFTIYALPEASGLTSDMAGQEAIDLLADQATATAQLRGEYETPD